MNNHPFPSSEASVIRATGFPRWLAGIVLALAATLALAAAPPRNVLVLYSDNRLLPGLAVIDETLDRVLRAEFEPEIELFNEFLDLDRSRLGAYEDEREVLDQVVVGKLNKQIAGDLGTVEKTIKVHRARVMEKMGARSLAELARMGERLGIGVPDAKD